MILHARQVVLLRGVDKRGNRDPCQCIVRERRRVRRHEHYGPYPRIAELWKGADLASSFPSGSIPEAAELRVVGMLAAMRGLRAGTGSGTGDRQRCVATIRMAHHPDTITIDVSPEVSVFQDRINDAETCFGRPTHTPTPDMSSPFPRGWVGAATT